MRALLLLLAIPLAGCATVSARPEIPASLLSCAAEPAPPPKPRQQSAVAGWTLDVVEAGRDCRGKLDAVRRLEAREVRP